jgi:hypothetical protein
MFRQGFSGGERVTTENVPAWEVIMQRIICQAIRERRLIEVVYHDRARVIAPHTYGVDTTGDELLKGYQVSGDSLGGEVRGWKSLKVAQVSKLKLTALHFHPRPEYVHGDRALARILCQV